LSTLVSLDAVPVIDNHSHASQLEQRKRSSATTSQQYQEVFARGYIEARVPPRVWHDYIEAVHTKDTGRLEEIDREYRTEDLLKQSLQMRSTTTFTRALQIGYSELYGEWENLARREELSVAARQDGTAKLYERVMDMVNCPVVLTDTPRLDRSQWSEKRFKWIARLDPFLFPFGPGELTARGTEVAAFHARLGSKLEIALREQGLDAAPPAFDDYLAFVDRVVQSFVDRGVTSFKFVSAYVRPLQFNRVDESEARRVYRDLAQGRKQESRLFEDYVAHRLLEAVARLDIPLQIHVGMGHAEPGMDFYGNNPLMLQSILMDERYSNLKIILLHGSYPFCSEAGALAWTYGNVFLDFSWMTYLHHHFLIDRLSEWLEYLPANKLVFGTDTGLPEMHLGATRLGRRALEVALSRGVEAQLWSNAQAEWLGERVCYQNVCDIYGISL
jgi:uncharacterized protein